MATANCRAIDSMRWLRSGSTVAQVVASSSSRTRSSIFAIRRINPGRDLTLSILSREAAEDNPDIHRHRPSAAPYLRRIRTELVPAPRMCSIRGDERLRIIRVGREVQRQRKGLYLAAPQAGGRR